VPQLLELIGQLLIRGYNVRVMLPSLIGQYRIVRKIGAGGMGLVYLGEHTLLRRRAAIKTLLPTVAANKEIVERFFNEARATSAIADPGVIQIFDFGYHVDGTAYIVMELLEGEALSARLDRLGKLALGDALRFARQVTGSLAAAHARDIVHRDLKPENIFLVRDAEAQGGERTKIIDFGICKVGAGDPMLTEVGVMIGTPVYMSPEQCRGSAEVDARSDVYAFGCLLFHMLTGRPPFVGEASGDLVVAHLEQEPPPPSQLAPGLPPAVDALVLRCLAKPPDERFASMVELQAALGALAVDTEAAEPEVPAPARTVPLGRGFRSVYDANLAAALGGSSVFRPGSPVPDALRARLTFAPPPAITPTGEEDDGNGELAPRSRAGVRAALACVLVVGVAAGLIATPLIVSKDRTPSAAAGAGPAAPLRVEAEPVEPPPETSGAVRAVPPAVEAAAPAEAPSAEPTPAAGPSRGAIASVIAAPVAAPAADAEQPSPARADQAPPARADQAPPARADQAPPVRHSSSKAAPRVRPSGEPRTGRAQVSGPRASGASGASGPVRSPVDLEPARPVRSAPAAAPPPSASASPPSAAPPPSAITASPPARPATPPPPEDLYDTR
jgi:serine/threonine-protein kinase